MSKPKLIIHETDCHGCGNIYYKGKCNRYSYDGDGGDMKIAVEELIRIGFINAEDVAIFTDDTIYNYVEKGLKEG